MTLGPCRGGWVIAATVCAAMVLTIAPGPRWIEAVRPEWTALVLIYWSLALPHRVGIGVAWFSGLLVDVLTDSLLGEHALSFSLIAYITLKIYRRTRLSPVWQQAVTVLGLLSLHQLLSLWVRGMTGHAPQQWLYWTPALVGMAFWPPTFLLLRRLRRQLQVS